jgi:hypothetical protein
MQSALDLALRTRRRQTILHSRWWTPCFSVQCNEGVEWRCANWTSGQRLLRVSVVRREEMRAYEIFEPARPRLVCVAPYVHAHGDHGLFRCNNPGIKIDIKDEVRNLLNSAGDRNLGTQFFREIGVAAATLLKVCLALHPPPEQCRRLPAFPTLLQASVTADRAAPNGLFHRLGGRWFPLQGLCQ